MRYRSLRGPVSVQLEITEACNLDCVHCYNHWRDKSQSTSLHHLDEIGLKTIIDSITKVGASSVTLTGGEPLLFPDLLSTAITRLIANGIYVGLNTNLTLMTEKTAIDLKNAGLNHILVSVLCSNEKIHDELTNREGSWRKTMEGIKIARKHGFRVSSNMVLVKKNKPYLRQTAELMKELGVTSFCATKASPALNSRNFEELILSREELKESLDELIKIKSKLGIKVDVLECYPLCLIGDVTKYSVFARHSCTAGVTTCTIGPSGGVRPCSHADMVYGNVFKESLSSIWEKMEDWRSGQYIPDECHKCQFVERCSGGCRMEAKYKGNIKGRDSFMTSSEDVIPGHEAKRERTLDISSSFQINRPLRIREEEFGAMISVSGNALLVNNDAAVLLKELDRIGEFTASYINSKYGLEVGPVLDFLARLLESGIIRIIK